MSLVTTLTEALKGVANGISTLDGAIRNEQPPQLHAGEHTDGTDDIQNATDSLKGLATATQITKLDGIEPDATKSTFDEQAEFYFVSPGNGSDVTGDGSMFNPYETIEYLLTVVAGGPSIIVDDTFQGVNVTIPPGRFPTIISTINAWLDVLTLSQGSTAHVCGGLSIMDVQEAIGVTNAGLNLFADVAIIDATDAHNTNLDLFGALNYLPASATTLFKTVNGVSYDGVRLEAWGGLDLKSTKATNMLDPTLAQDGATKNYVDSRPTLIIQDSEEAEDASTVQLPSFTESITFTKTLVIGQKYVIDWQCSIKGIASNNGAVAEFRVNGTDMISEMDQHYDHYDTKSGIFFFTPSAESNTFAFYFAKEGASGTAYIKQKRIIIMKVVE